ncbi:hypothetical protein Tco_0914029, partial [Tanacetum coccineum]
EHIQKSKGVDAQNLIKKLSSTEISEHMIVTCTPKPNDAIVTRDATMKLPANKATTREDVDGVSKKYVILLFNQRRQIKVCAKRTNVRRFMKFIARRTSSYGFRSQRSYKLAPPNVPPYGYNFKGCLATADAARWLWPISMGSTAFCNCEPFTGCLGLCTISSEIPVLTTGSDLRFNDGRIGGCGCCLSNLDGEEGVAKEGKNQFAAEIADGTLLICDVAATCVGSTRGATQGRPRRGGLQRRIFNELVGLVDAVVAYLIQFAAEIVAGTLLISDVAATCVGSTRGAIQVVEIKEPEPTIVEIKEPRSEILGFAAKQNAFGTGKFEAGVPHCSKLPNQSTHPTVCISPLQQAEQVLLEAWKALIFYSAVQASGDDPRTNSPATCLE